MLNLASFSQTEATTQTVLPDRRLLIGQKWLENAKIQKFKCDILGDFQTLCISQGVPNFLVTTFSWQVFPIPKNTSP